MLAEWINGKNIRTLCRDIWGPDLTQDDLRRMMHILYCLPEFFHAFIRNYYYLDLSDTETAATLNISEALVRQRISVSTTLIKILYASKPKNPV